MTARDRKRLERLGQLPKRPGISAVAFGSGSFHQEPKKQEKPNA